MDKDMVLSQAVKSVSKTGAERLAYVAKPFSYYKELLDAKHGGKGMGRKAYKTRELWVDAYEALRKADQAGAEAGAMGVIDSEKSAGAAFRSLVQTKTDKGVITTHSVFRPFEKKGDEAKLEKAEALERRAKAIRDELAEAKGKREALEAITVPTPPTETAPAA